MTSSEILLLKGDNLPLLSHHPEPTPRTPQSQGQKDVASGSPLHGSHMLCFNLALGVESRGLLTTEQEAGLRHLQQDEPDELPQVQATDHLFKPMIQQTDQSVGGIPLMVQHHRPKSRSRRHGQER